MSSTNWGVYLDAFKVSDLLDPDFTLVQVENTAKVGEVLTLLKEKGIHSVPVWDSAKSVYLGLVDTLDILSVAVSLSDLKKWVDTLSADQASWDDFLQREDSVFATGTVATMCNTSSRNPWVPLSVDSPLADLLDLCGRACGLHRVPVIDDDGFMRGLVTQSEVFKWLAANMMLFNEALMNKTVSELSLGSEGVISLPSTATALDAYHLLVQKSVSGLAIVDENGALVGAISDTNILSSLGIDLFKNLYLSLSTYLFHQKNSLTPITVTSQATLADVMSTITTHGVHRVFVVDENNKPIRVISLTDLISSIERL